jgi:hypothetical protein
VTFMKHYKGVGVASYKSLGTSVLEASREQIVRVCPAGLKFIT